MSRDQFGLFNEAELVEEAISSALLGQGTVHYARNKPKRTPLPKEPAQRRYRS